MQSTARQLAVLVIAASIVLGAAGLSGHLVGEDHCTPTVEGTYTTSERRWTPPGRECLTHAASSIGPDGRFAYADERVTVTDRTGSWPWFATALALGLGLVGLAARRRPDVPTWLRLTVDTTLVFAVAGLGALYGGWAGSVLTAVFFGVPAAVMADRGVWPGRRATHPWVAGAAAAAMTLAAVVVSAGGWLWGLGAESYGLALVLVALVGAVPARIAAMRGC